ncbi:MAG TPA: hypothetical protein VKE53_01185 [Pseudolabrys sp.]|jgi:hypothetical protein|nr:hypothetical protein [Pseudolabrys sp.]
MRLTNIFGASVLFGLALGAATLVFPAPARAADDDLPIDRKIMRNIMEGLGLKRDGEEMINYRERSPLVIPPNRELPPPERSDAAITSNPAWPKDPDVERRKAQALMENNRNVSDEREREQNPLRPDQLTPGGRAKKKQARTDDGYEAPASGFGSQLLPSELGFKGFGSFFSGKKEESAKFTGEPPRDLLTDPPPGYQTPSPDQPYGLGKAAAPKATDYYTTHSEPTR